MIDVWDHSAVNFIARCFSFKWSINSFSFSSPCFQRKTMSFVYLHHRYGFSSISLSIFSSNSVINNILCGGANFVLIAVHRFCFKVFFVKRKNAVLKNNLSNFYKRWGSGIFSLSQEKRERAPLNKIPTL